VRKFYHLKSVHNIKLDINSYFKIVRFAMFICNMISRYYSNTHEYYILYLDI